MPTPRVSIFAGMFAAALFAIAWVVFGLAYWPEPALNTLTAIDRLQYALICEIFLTLTLLLGVGLVAQQRFFSDQQIDGSEPDKGSALDINIRYLQNTLEQVVLAVIAHLALALVVPASSLNIIPVLVSLFVIARICFLVGYHISAPARAFGFATTFYPTVGVYVYVIGVVLDS